MDEDGTEKSRLGYHLSATVSKGPPKGRWGQAGRIHGMEISTCRMRFITRLKLLNAAVSHLGTFPVMRFPNDLESNSNTFYLGDCNERSVQSIRGFGGLGQMQQALVVGCRL